MYAHRKFIAIILIAIFLFGCQIMDVPPEVFLATQQPTTITTIDAVVSQSPGATYGDLFTATPAFTPVPTMFFESLPRVTISADTPLLASPSHPASIISSTTVKQGDVVQVVGTDVNSAWLLVIYKNMLGWVPSLLSKSGAGTLDTLILVESQTINCKSYYGVVSQPSNSWVVENSNMVVQGLLYLSGASRNIDNVAINLHIGKDRDVVNIHIEKSVLDKDGGLFLFTSLLENLVIGEKIYFSFDGVDEATVPFQASYFSDECGDQVDFSNVNPSGSDVPLQPMATRVIYIQSTAEGPTSVPKESLPSAYRCPDLSGVTLYIGAKAKVLQDVNMRSYPKVPMDWDANIVTVLHKNDKLIVIGGPECAHDGTWWEVKTNTGNTGWMREFLPDKRLLKLN